MRRAIALTGALTLAACVATPTLLEPGPYPSEGGGVTVMLERAWTEIPEELSAFTDAPYLTFDGPRLNQVHVLSGVPSGESFIKERPNGEPGPAFRAGMSPTEIVDLVTESVAMLGYQNVTAVEVAPRPLAGSAGVWLVFTGAQENGLRVKGAALASETAGALDLMLFIAPETHYYDALMPEVERIFASATRG